MSIFTRFWYNVKYPQLLPGPDIITANVSWNIFLLFRIIAPAVRISHNDDAVNHDGGRAMSNESVFWIYPMDWIDLVSQAFLKIDNTVFAKFVNGLPGGCIQHHHIIARCHNNDPSFAVNFCI